LGLANLQRYYSVSLKLMLELDLEKRAERFLEKLPKKHAAQIARKLLLLLEDPYPSDSKLLHGVSLHRLDSGEYRVIYRVERKTLEVYLVGRRNDGEVYRKLDRL